MQQDFTIILGDKTISSWSLRAWLMLKQTGVDFKEHIIPLNTPNTKHEILKYSGAGKVPILKHNDIFVWESLAIGEYLSELFPDAKLWPEDKVARAHARSISSEMHAGFITLRKLMPFVVNQIRTVDFIAELMIDIKRIETIWQECRERYRTEGPYLFGHFTIADAMFAPVVLRFQTYEYISSNQVVLDYSHTILDHPFIQEWRNSSL